MWSKAATQSAVGKGLGKGQVLGRMQQCIKAKTKTTMASVRLWSAVSSPLHNSARSSTLSSQARFPTQAVCSFKMRRWTVGCHDVINFLVISRSFLLDKILAPKTLDPKVCLQNWYRNVTKTQGHHMIFGAFTSLFSIIGSTRFHNFFHCAQTGG